MGRLLLIDYHFGTAATGGFRWNAMARHLVPMGWTFDVITLGAPTTAPVETSPGIRVHAVPVPATLVDQAMRSLAAVKRGLRGRPAPPSSAVPAAAPPVPAAAAPPGPTFYSRLTRALDATRITSAEWGWSNRARDVGLALLRGGRYEAVVVSSPPHLTQLAGAALARRTGVPYVADFRDPWVFGRPEKYDVNLLANRLGQRYEAATLRRASLIIGNTEHARRAVAELYPALADRTLAVPNGYDADAPVTGRPDPRTFRIVFAGWLYPFMDHEAVLAAAGRLRQRAGLGPGRLAVQFMGSGEPGGPRSFQALASRHGLDGCVQQLPASPRAEARALQASAAVLVAFDASTQLAMPTKFYDYAQMCGTMLLVGFPDGAMAAAAAVLDMKVHEPADAAGLDATLDAAFRRWERGELTAPADPDGLFDRRRQSERVHAALLALGSRQA